MRIYKRSLWVMFKGLIMAPCAAAVVFFVLNFFVQDYLILFGIPGLIFLVLIYLAVISENIRFELDDLGKLRYYKKGRLKKEYVLAEYLLGFNSRSDGTTTDITLLIINIKNGAEEHIDCSPIGERKFSDMYARVKKYTKEQPEVLKAD